MRGGGGSDESVDVDLVEQGDAVPEDAGADAAHAPLRSDRELARERVVRWIGLAVVLALVVVAGVANLFASRREAARRDVLAAVPWVLERMGGPLEEVWRTPGGWLVTQQDDVAVVADAPSSGQLRGLDPATGEEVWSRTGGPSDDCYILWDETDVQGWSSGVSPWDLDELACVHQTGAGGEGSAGWVEVLDVRTGAELAVVEFSGVAFVEDVLGDDLLVAWVGADDSLGATRVERRTGTMRWTYQSDPGALPEGVDGWTVADGILKVGWSSPIALSLETGAKLAVVPDADVSERSVHLELAGGAVAEWSWGANSRGTGGRVLEPDGAVRFTFPGAPWRPTLSDGSAAGVLVVQAEHREDGLLTGESELIGLDLVTGDRLWTIVDDNPWPVVQLGGVTVANSGSGLGPIDLTAGERPWVIPRGQIYFTSSITDGDVLLVVVRDQGGMDLVAIDLRTGTEAWRMPCPDGMNDLRNLDETVLMITEDEIIAYR
jgi:outer membrane protein assembly factor BamB